MKFLKYKENGKFGKWLNDPVYLLERHGKIWKKDMSIVSGIDIQAMDLCVNDRYRYYILNILDIST